MESRVVADARNREDLYDLGFVRVVDCYCTVVKGAILQRRSSVSEADSQEYVFPRHTLNTTRISGCPSLHSQDTIDTG